MSAIKVAYPNYYKNQTEIDDAINLWAEMLAEDDPVYIAKAVKEFIKTDTKGFPPVIGQIRAAAKDIRHTDYVNKQSALMIAQAEESEKGIPMPDEIRDKLSNLFKTPRT
jgi:hypothetical protein